MTRFVEAPGGVGRHLDVDFDESVRACLVRQQRQRFRQRLIARLHLPQPQDIAAEIGDRGVEAVDRAPELSLCLHGLGVHALGDVLEQQADAVERLHHTVVEIHADALALLQHGHALDLLVQSGVLDRDRGLRRKRLERFAVIRREFLRPLFLGEIEVPKRLAAQHDRRADEAAHRRVILRETHRGGMLVKVPQAEGPAFLLQMPQ